MSIQETADQGDGEPTSALGFAVGTQPGPDGKNLIVSVHVGTGVMSVVFVVPPDSADEFADQLAKDIKKAAKQCRISNSGLIVK